MTQDYTDIMEVRKFTQIRVKSIEFLEQKATAIYFYDMTHHIESLELESKVLEQKNRNESIVSYQMTISHEFRTPLASSLMMLENLLAEVITKQATNIIKIIISQINLLLCLVNDILDLKLIEENKFVPKNEVFSPRETFNFITKMFAP